MNYWAHRGLSRLYPENTLTAFRAACEYDIAGIELDIQMSADGALVVIHDETVDRTTDGAGEVRAMTLEELRALKIPAGFGTENAGRFERIPLFSEVLELCAPYCMDYGMFLDVELKTGKYEYPGIEEKALTEVRACGLDRHVIWSSFSPQSLKRLRELDPGCRIAVISKDVETGLQACAELGCRELHPYFGKLKETAAKHPELRRYRIRPWLLQKEEPLFPAPAAAGDGYSGTASDPVTLSEKELTAVGASALITSNCDLYCEKRRLQAARLQVMAEAQKLRPDYTVDPETGVLKAYKGMAATPEALHIRKGDTIEPAADGVSFCLFHYREGTPGSGTREGGNLIDSNETTYCGIRVPRWYSEPFTFEEDGYVRVVFRDDPASGAPPLGQEPRLDDLVRFRRADRPEPVRSGELFEKEAVRLEERLREQAGPDDLRFLLCTDSHYTVGGTWSRTAQVLKSVCRRISPDALIFLGDFTDGDLPVEETLRYAKRVLEDLESTGLPLFICLGNHDFNTMSTMKARVSRKAAEKLFLGRNENMVIDYEHQRVRMIFLASFDPDDRANPYGFSTADVFWFSRAVASAPRGFRILVFSHVTPAAEIHHWSDTIRNGPKMISVLEKEQKKHGNVLAWICGHNHADQIFRTYAFPIVTIASLKIDHYRDPEGGVTTYRRKSYGGVAPERLYDGVSRECFDILSVSKDKNELRFLRFGAGEDRIV